MIGYVTSRLATLAACAALALGTAAPAPAMAEDRPEEGQLSENTAGLLFFGLAAVALIAHLNTRNDDKDADRAAPPPDRIDQRTVAPRSHDPRALPAQCLRRLRTSDGPVRLYMRHCLHRAGIPVHELPRACERRITRHDGAIRRGYVPRCLARHGVSLPRTH